MPYEINPLAAPVTRTEFPRSVQWQNEGVNLGAPNVRVVNIVADPAVYQVTRGTGEHSNVITIRTPTVPTDPMFADVLLLMAGDSTTDDLSPHNRFIIGGGGSANVSVSTDHLLFGKPVLKIPPSGPSAALNVDYGYAPGYVDPLTLDSRDFSIEFFQWVDASPGSSSHQPTVIFQGPSTPLLLGTGLVDSSHWSAWGGFNSVSSPGAWGFQMNTGVLLNRGSWDFVQLIRSGSTFTLAINGAVIGTATFAGNIDDTSGSGSYVFATNQGFVTQHYIAQYRVTRGVRPIAVPTAPWPIL